MMRPGLVGGALALTAGLSAQAAPTTSLTVSGRAAAPGVYGSAALQALPAATQTVTYRAAGTPVTDTFTGPTLWSLLQASGGVVTNPANKNDLLRSYVVATGSDGYEAVISAGEIAPKFGNKSDLIAYADTGGRLPSPDGFARVVLPGDVAGGRYVSNLTDLHVGTAPAQAGTGGGTPSQLSVGGAVAHAVTETLGALRAFTPYTETATYLAGAASVTDTYTGALLWDVLAAAGVLTDPAIKNDILRKLVTVTGSDGYQVDLSLGEIDPAFGNAPILLAYEDTGGQLTGTYGFARLVAPGDIAGGRYVSNLASLTVLDPTVPEPGGIGIVLAGLAAICCAASVAGGRSQARNARPECRR